MSYCRCRFAEADADVPTTPSPAWRASPRAVGGPTGGAAHACDARVRCMMAAVSGQASSNLTGKLASEVAAVAGRGGQEVTPHWGSLHGRGRIGKLQIALFGVLSAESAYRPRAAARSGRFGLFCPKSAHFLAQMSTCDTPSPTTHTPDVLHPESKQQTTPASPRDALECVAALARTRECRQDCVSRTSSRPTPR